MTDALRAGNVKCMRRLIFGTLLAIAVTRALPAQRVPGRELLDFPVGTLGEAPTLARSSGDGLWNPAAIVLASDARFKVSVAALNTPSDQGVSSHLLAAAVQIPGRRTVGLSVVRAGVSEIWRTETDPQTSGPEIPYTATIVSASLAQRRNGLSLGLAGRYRHGQMDGLQRGAFGLDGGLMLQGLLGLDLNLGAATFLWRPGDSGNERTTFSAAADLRVVGRDSLRQARVGYSLSLTEQSATEHYALASGRHGVWQGRLGVVHHTEYGHADWRLRVGVGVHYARYTIGVAREENGAGLAPSYQFGLSATIE